MTDWKLAQSTERPAELDTASSRTTVYMRKDIIEKIGVREVQAMPDTQDEPATQEVQEASDVSDMQDAYDTQYAHDAYDKQEVQEGTQDTSHETIQTYTYYEYLERTMTHEEYANYVMLQEQTEEIIKHNTEKDIERAIDDYTLSLVEGGLL